MILCHIWYNIAALFFDFTENELTSGCPMVSTDSDADYLHMNPRELEQAKKDDMVSHTQ